MGLCAKVKLFQPVQCCGKLYNNVFFLKFYYVSHNGEFNLKKVFLHKNDESEVGQKWSKSAPQKVDSWVIANIPAVPSGEVSREGVHGCWR